MLQLNKKVTIISKYVLEGEDIFELLKQKKRIEHLVDTMNKLKGTNVIPFCKLVTSDYKHKILIEYELPE